MDTDILEKIEKTDIFTENCPKIVDAFHDIFNLKFDFFVIFIKNQPMASKI